MEIISYPFSLPVGYIDGDGSLVKDVEITEMRGKLRKRLNTFQKDPRGLIDFILNHCVVKLGDRDPSATQIKNLLSVDRQFLLLMIRKVSIDPVLNLTYVCRACQEANSFSVDIDDQIPIKYLEDCENCKLEGNNVVIHMKDEQKGFDVKMRLPKGLDEDRIAGIKDPIDANYVLYELCLLSCNGEEAPIPHFTDNAPVRLLDWISEEFKDEQPGADFVAKHYCENCGVSNSVDISTADFLFKTQD